MIEWDMLKNALIAALAKLYQQDGYLINHAFSQDCETNHACERAAVFRFGHYFAALIEEQMPGYVVDSEYSLALEEKRKILPSWPNGCYPDIILHRRGQTENVLALEVKGWWGKHLEHEINRDIRKILELENHMNYQYGAVILLEKEFPRIFWIDGKENPHGN